MLPAIIPLLIRDNGYSYLAAGLLVTAYNLASSCTQPVVGWLADTRGFSVSISISLLISGVFIALMGIAHDYRLILLLAILAALGHACFHPAALSRVSRLCSTGNRGRITSYFVVGGNLGYAIGPAIAGALVYWYGLPGLLFLVLPALLMVLALRYLLPGGIAGGCPPVRQQVPAPAGETPSKRPFAILMAASVLRAWAIYAAITFLPTYLVGQGYTLFGASAIVTLMLLAGVGGQVFGGQISDRYGRKEFMVFGLAAAVPLFWLFFVSTGFVAIAFLLLFGFALWSTFAVAVAMGHELLPQNVGLASGMMLGLAIGVGGLGVAVNGMIADQYSLGAALCTIPVPLIAALLLMAVLPYPWKSLARVRAGEKPA